MLDVITDFWKPSRKALQEPKIDLDGLQTGSSIGFGFVPQSILSGRRFAVNTINTYQFGEERLTSFMLVQDANETVSMIVANAEGEKYLALSRRIPQEDRERMFDMGTLDDVLTKADVKRLSSRDLEPGWKQWMVGQYKKEIHALLGKLISGDYRTFNRLPEDITTKPFEYTLLVSDNNEYAIEAERYQDGRLEVYATIYRRITDIGEVVNPSRDAGNMETEIPQPAAQPVLINEEPHSASLQAEKSIEAEKSTAAQRKQFRPEPETPLLDLTEEANSPTIGSAEAEIEKTNESLSLPAIEPASPASVTLTALPKENTMAVFTSNSGNGKQEGLNGSGAYTNGAGQPESAKPAGASVQSQIPQSYIKQEAKAVSQRNGVDLENDAIECDLRVANKIIEEAIRNEIRLSDVIRRIIALPVAYPESVQIPVTLSDADFQLLAIRYGISSNDRDSIKEKIISEINDFSGGSKQ